MALDQMTSSTWLSKEILAHRMKAAAPYMCEGGLEELHETGKITLRPHGRRVLLRAILSTDASAMSHGVSIDARRCIAHEVVAIGAGAAKYWDTEGVPPEARPKAGDHVFIVSAASDRMSKTDATVRLVAVLAEDIVSFWTPPK